ncbi:phosphomevalonate kinase [Coemansia erecta]|uniref:Phosphomevalonate kinase n=1 Tax=Coemansia erecta TaxID=147472 RepID=A0A9W7XXI4_9FUNG|nr:phosphomevalonate kinase [Coemansia erecta]
MSHSPDAVTLASAPGKVLVAGGYLVLDRRYSGLVVGTDACLYAAVKTQPLATTTSSSASSSLLSIFVRSPQFTSAWWRYAFDPSTSTLRQTESADGTENTFVHVVLETALALANARQPGKLRDVPGLMVALLADNDFYSQRRTLEERGLALTAEALASLPRMGPVGCALRDVHKTGLGSSAAMVTSLVAALLAHLGVVGSPSSSSLSSSASHPDEWSSKERRLVHNVAQLAHCLAQGKVGSGFDVSAAVYGSHVYTRFSPAVLEPAMAATHRPSVANICAAADADDSNALWDGRVEPVDVPPRLLLRLADVNAGSSTPGMVRQVLAWQKEHPVEAKQLWDALDAANTRVRQLWDALHKAADEDRPAYDAVVDWCAERACAGWRDAQAPALPAVHLLADLVDATQAVRALQRTMGANAGVPIEPAEQTRLLDACMLVPGVCMAAVPGAGGYDAIYCVTLGDAPGRAVAALWAAWSEMSVGPLLANQASGGVRLLDPRMFPEATSALSPEE